MVTGSVSSVTPRLIRGRRLSGSAWIEVKSVSWPMAAKGDRIHS
jgi:hypothetical protein